MKKKIVNYQPVGGFTLIEILVSITVIMILIGLTFAGYARFNRRQNLINAGQTLKNVLRDAQSRAYNSEMDCSVCDCVNFTTPLSGWYADFSSKTIFGRCGANEFSSTGFGLSSDIVITPYLTPPAPTPVFFRAFPPGTGSGGTVCLSDPDLSGSFYKIDVKYSGEISDSNGLIGTCP